MNTHGTGSAQKWREKRKEKLEKEREKEREKENKERSKQQISLMGVLRGDKEKGTQYNEGREVARSGRVISEKRNSERKKRERERDNRGSYNYTI